MPFLTKAITMNNISAEQQQGVPPQPEDQHELALRTHNRRIVVEGLRGLGVLAACMTYDGGGDEGQAREITYQDRAGQPMSATDALTTKVVTLTRQHVQHDDGQWLPQTVEVTVSLEQAWEDLAWGLVEHLHHGFWNGDGGVGEVNIVLEENGTDSITVNHSDLVVTTETTETVL